MKKFGFLKRTAAAALSLLLAVGGIPSCVQATESGSGVAFSLEVVNQIENTNEAQTPLKAVQFAFTMKGENGTEPLPANATLTITGAGTDSFGPIQYTTPGIYKYTIFEEEGSEKGYQYDSTIYNLVVTVKTASDGSLVLTAKAYKNDGEDGKCTSATFTNKFNLPIETETPKISVGFRKVDEAGSDLTGAVLKLVEVTEDTVDGQTITNYIDVDKWTTDGSVHTVDGLLEGHVYRLVEIEAPDGYEFARDIEFTADADEDTIQMTDEKKPDPEKLKGSVTVTKQLTVDDSIKIAPEEKQTFYVALFEDAECTHRVTEIKELDFKQDSAVTVTFDELLPDTVYYLGEADENGFKLVSGEIDGVIFYTDFIQGQAVTASTQEGAASLTFNNDFVTIPQHFYREGELTITKKLVDASGNAANASETFYAGIFADPQFKTLSDQVVTNIVALPLNGTSQASATVKAVLPESGTLNLYVTEVDANGTPVSQSTGFPYEVTVSGSEISLDVNNPSAAVTITNKGQQPQTTATTETTKATESESESESETVQSTAAGSTEQTNAATTSVKTGDDTPMELYLILLAASAAIILLVITERRRRRNI